MSSFLVSILSCGACVSDILDDVFFKGVKSSALDQYI